MVQVVIDKAIQANLPLPRLDPRIIARNIADKYATPQAHDWVEIYSYSVQKFNEALPGANL